LVIFEQSTGAGVAAGRLAFEFKIPVFVFLIFALLAVDSQPINARDAIPNTIDKNLNLIVFPSMSSHVINIYIDLKSIDMVQIAYLDRGHLLTRLLSGVRKPQSSGGGKEN
jgi:hypothetical protein